MKILQRMDGFGAGLYFVENDKILTSINRGIVECLDSEDNIVNIGDATFEDRLQDCVLKIQIVQMDKFLA